MKVPPASILAYLSFLCICIVVAILCELNRGTWDENVFLQSVASSAFCIYAASLYLTYMIITKLLHLVLTYAESNTYTFRSRRVRYSNVSVNYDYEEDPEEDEYASPEEEDEEEEDGGYSSDFIKRSRQFIHAQSLLFMYRELGKKQRKRQRKEVLPRSVIISSMYLGGSGAFLAIIPLCMWDFSVTASFVNSMLTISMIDAKRLSPDFRPDTDKVQAIKVLKTLRYGYHALSIISTLVIGYVDITHATPPNVMSESAHVSAILLKWPFLFLATCSPILLRAGGGGVGNFIYSLSPSHTLEIGLPVSVLLAILVLCWHSPTENILNQHEFHMSTALPMLFICPLCLAGALTFILYGFKRRSCGIISCILLLTLAVRQQMHEKHRFRDLHDVTSFCLSLASFAVMLIYLACRYRYEGQPPPKAEPTIEPEQETAAPVSTDGIVEEAEV